MLNDRCSGYSCLRFGVHRDGQSGEKEGSGHLPYCKRSFLWCDYDDSPGELFYVLFKEWLVIYYDSLMREFLAYYSKYEDQFR